MEKLPVKLLTELLTPEEIIAANRVKILAEAPFCPVAVSLPEEGCGGKWNDGARCTPRANFAIRILKTARDALLKRPDFSGVLEVEWYPVAATFNSVRFVNGSPERFVAALFDEMKRLADHSGGAFSWRDIADAFVVLKPIQLAFLAGDAMNRHTPLDDEFIDACGRFDLEKVRELVVKGANIHAAANYGDTAISTMMDNYYDLNDVDEKGHFRFDDKNYDAFLNITRYLLSLGYDINLAGYAAPGCLHAAPHVENMELIKFLLDNGADPNLGSFLGEFSRWEMGITPLEHTWDDLSTEDSPWCEKLALVLLRYGALPVPAGERLTAEDLDQLIEEENIPEIYASCRAAGFSELDSALIYCADEFCFYHLALIAQNGGNVAVRDTRGRNLLQIALDNGSSASKHRIAEMSLMLLCGLKLKLTAAELELAKETCRAKGFDEALAAISSAAASFKHRMNKA